MNRTQLINDVFDSYRYLRRAFLPPKKIKTLANAPTRAQIGILFVVAQEKSMSIKKLSTQLSMTPSAVTQLVDPLVQSLLISRSTDMKDRRRIHLILTKSGKKILQVVRRQRIKALTTILAPLSDNELRQLAVLQHKLSSIKE